jgi:hypothetical protein
MRGWTRLEHALPELATLSNLAGPGLIGLRKLVSFDLVKGSFVLDSPVMLTSAINKPVTSYLNQERAKMGAVSESPAGLPKATQNICPN